MVTQVVHEEVQIVEQRIAGAKVSNRFLPDALVFFAGVVAFHTLSHVWLGLSGMLPMEIKFPSMTVTHNLNLVAIAVNALITVGLLYGANRLTKKDSRG